MSVPVALDGLDARLDAVAAALAAAMPSRTVSRSFVPFDARSPEELKAGVVMLLSAGEKGYSTALGMAAREGEQGLVIVGHLLVEEATDPVAIEQAEIALMEEIKGFVQAGVAGMDLQLTELQQSRQQHHPYGWVTAYLTARSPRTNVY